MNAEEKQATTDRKTLPAHLNLPWKSSLLFIMLVGLLLSGCQNYPSISELINPANTVTEQPTLTPTPRPTRTPTISPSPTLEPTITPTPLPVSAYYLPNGWELQPPIRGVTGGVIVLDEATSATVEPGFDTPYWISSEQIAKESGFDILERYYATFGYGSIQWETDVPLGPGMYEIYVMDTLYSSAGPLEFQIHQGEMELFPLIGSRQVEFLSPRGEPPQRTNLWRSLGIYQLHRLEKLSISSAWERRDERTLVAVDRVIIVPMPDSTNYILSALPLDRQIVMIDNTAADIESAQLLYEVEGEMSWGDQYQYAINPTKDLRILYSAPEHLPPGTYKVMIWVPPGHATLDAGYTLLVNGNEFSNEAGQETKIISFSEFQGEQWLDLGNWTTPRIYEKPVQLALRMEIKGGQPGEGAFDVIALIRWDQPQESP
jgi:hypothetical protein